MPVLAVDELVSALAMTDIAELELTGPDVHLLLHRTPSGAVDRIEPAPAAAPAPAAITVTAPGAGHFFARHPLREAPLAAVGAQVAAGAVLGLLQVEALLLPVVAPEAGELAAVLVAEGTLVGFGTPLFELTTGGG
jgi:acetyl-CoA carboxylase biotin carboxyl carrier protein